MLGAMTPATSAKPLPSVNTVDGRTARAARTNDAVVDAWLSLIESGDLRPGARQIAERAGVSLRSVFHHFEDLETLYATAAERQLRRFFSGPPLSADGSLTERVERFVLARSRQLEAVTPMRRAAVLNEPFSPPLAARLKWARERARNEVERMFRVELSALRPTARREVLAALAVAAEWSMWEALRVHQELSVPQAQRVMKRTIAALLRP
jgi:TetR/AcrR family transcriptional regulator of autoinduction and epiphytic fitness